MILKNVIGRTAKGLSTGLEHKINFVARLSNNAGGRNGNSWVIKSNPYLVYSTGTVDGNPETVNMVGDGGGNWVWETGTGYIAAHASRRKLSIDGDDFRVQGPDGKIWAFYGAEALGGLRGCLRTITLPNGIVTSTAYGANGLLESITRTDPQTGNTALLSYTYATEGIHQWRILTVDKILTEAGIISPLTRKAYTYHDGGDSAGSVNDLKTAEELVYQADQKTWISVGKSYYRYYKSDSSGGFTHGLRYEVKADAYARMTELGLIPENVEQVTDAVLSNYATGYYEYNSQRLLTKRVLNAGTNESSFTQLASDGAPGRNWVQKTVETLPNGSTSTLYKNEAFKPLLKVLSSGGDSWVDYYEYNSENRETLHATPEAVASFTEPTSALENFTVTLKTDAGLIDTKEYYPTIGGGAGSAPGYLKASFVQEGSSGTPVKVSERTYTSHTEGGEVIYKIASNTSYQSESSGGSDPATTSYEYTWKSGTFEVDQLTTNPPVVPVAQNGTNAEYERVTVTDYFGNVAWKKNERGFISYQIFDRLTGSMNTKIDDVDTAQVSDAPSGWLTPSGGGLNLVTTYESDRLGRITKELGPEHEVMLSETASTATVVRTTNFALYQDGNRDVWTAKGYATGEPGSYGYVTVGGVSVKRFDDAGQLLEGFQSRRECACGPLNSAESFPQSKWNRWSQNFYNAAGYMTAERVYHDIPESGDGLEGDDYIETRYSYDALGNDVRKDSPGGTVVRKVFNSRNLVTETWIGTDDVGAIESDPTGGGATGNNMKLITALEYDGGDDGGNWLVTKETKPVDGTSTNDRVVNYTYTFRDEVEEVETTDGVTAFITKNSYDNLQRKTQTDEYHTSVAAGNLAGRSKSYWDNLGRSYKTEIYAVNPSTGTVGNALVTEMWFDATGNLMKNRAPGSEAFTKTVYDGINRTTASYLAYNTGTSSNDGDVSGDVVVEQTETDYDDASNVIEVVSFGRFEDATGNGALNGPNGAQPKARRSYGVSWADGINRVRVSVNFGTNGGADLVRPAVAPERSDTVLVTTERYKDETEGIRSVIDPAGVETRWTDDKAGRRIQLVENFTGGVPTGDSDRTTEYAYHATGELERLTLKNSETGDQVTRWVFGTTLDVSEVATGNLLRAKIYPESDDKSAPLGNGPDGEYGRIEYEYSRQGDTVKMTDPNGTVHEYDFDELGRQTQDRITTFASGIDDAVKRISREYNNQKLIEKISSYDSATVGSGSVVNQVEYAYDDFRQQTEDKQSHSGTADGSTPKVSYSYENGSGNNTARRESVTYPNGRVVELGYGATDSQDDLMSRLSSLKINGESSNLVDYSYFGSRSLAKASFPEPAINLSYTKTAGQPVGDAGDQYTGYDRFGRTVDMRWVTSSGGAVRDRFEYGYDRASQRTWKSNLAASSSDNQDEFYQYDGLYQVTNANRGELNINRTAIGAIPAKEEIFSYDPTGNWDQYFEKTEGVTDLAQSRKNNKDNQITQFDGCSANVEYDKAGNSTKMTPDNAGEWSKHYILKWDGWNRLVEVKNTSDAVIATYAYDGAVRRTTKTIGANVTHFYYNDQWKCVEERADSSTDAKVQYVWGDRSRNDLILRDRDTNADGTLNERLYATHDAMASGTALFDATGIVQERYGYSAFGIRSVMAPDFSSRATSDFGWEFSFHGEFVDPETGYVNYGFRYYVPAVGRWINRDPIEERGGVNLYGFVYNNPINVIDILGQDPSKIAAIVGVVVAALGVIVERLAVRQLARCASDHNPDGDACRDCCDSAGRVGLVAIGVQEVAGVASCYLGFWAIPPLVVTCNTAVTAAVALAYQDLQTAVDSCNDSCCK